MSSGRCKGLGLATEILLLAAAACTGPNPAYVNRLPGHPDGAALGDAGFDHETPMTDALAARDQDDITPPPAPDAASVSLDLAADAPVAPPPDAPLALPDVAVDRAADRPPDSAPADAADPRPTAGLVADWPFNQKPASGTTIMSGGNSAVLHGIVWATEPAPGMPFGSQSMEFDGKTSYVDLTFASLPRAEAPKTIALWFRSTSSTPALRTLVALFTTTEELNLGVQLGFNGTALAAWRFGQAGSEMTAAATLNTWHHGTYTFANNVHRLYVDGKPLGTFTGAMKAGALNKTRLGTYDPPDELFKGQVNDFRVYDRVLSDAEIATLAHP